ncbi:hypothetical protein L198_02490 [Cryptococcus wingfieldii CBS 7118]|uniref:Uncharacterized protein n=1 Tax=Cryptococcus wingfieldii CBS 7118 TaxID=1295528 RepID=A0A1E3JRY1_9TREE|nr:hypothetical protein L198_02490 [Cryptococcus wingfieldii CBS 7118]ODO03639.1 hypothetical protein L198_02490 [Cryptococcus wingfieldii CBS 7118]
MLSYFEPPEEEHCYICFRLFLTQTASPPSPAAPLPTQPKSGNSPSQYRLSQTGLGLKRMKRTMSAEWDFSFLMRIRIKTTKSMERLATEGSFRSTSTFPSSIKFSRRRDNTAERAGPGGKTGAGGVWSKGGGDFRGFKVGLVKKGNSRTILRLLLSPFSRPHLLDTFILISLSPSDDVRNALQPLPTAFNGRHV